MCEWSAAEYQPIQFDASRQIHNGSLFAIEYSYWQFPLSKWSEPL